MGRTPLAACTDDACIGSAVAPSPSNMTGDSSARQLGFGPMPFIPIIALMAVLIGGLALVMALRIVHARQLSRAAARPGATPLPAANGGAGKAGAAQTHEPIEVPEQPTSRPPSSTPLPTPSCPHVPTTRSPPSVFTGPTFVMPGEREARWIGLRVESAAGSPRLHASQLSSPASSHPATPGTSLRCDGLRLDVACSPRLPPPTERDGTGSKPTTPGKALKDL
eukprot:SM000128S26241  [mRNA]  locus=s128:404981:405998:+ [translate_table: standard]